MYYKKSWQNFGLAVFTFGVTVMILTVCVARPTEIVPAIILFLFGLVLAVAGAYVLIWDWKDRKKDTQGKVDKSINYVFTLTTDAGTETVTDYAQIEKALQKLTQTKQGMVEVKIEPPMARICSVDCSYRKGNFYTYYLQERENGKGYWFSVCDTTYEAARSLKRLFVQHKKIEFEGLNHKETGEGR